MFYQIKLKKSTFQTVSECKGREDDTYARKDNLTYRLNQPAGLLSENPEYKRLLYLSELGG